MFSFDNDRIDVTEKVYSAGAITVGLTQVEAKANATGVRIATRQLIAVHNSASKTVYIGPSGVTIATGIPVFKDQLVSLPVGDLPVFLISDTAGQIVRVHEIG